ncbi:MAG: hypothetical protein E7440_07395 [Ruminococcaceae bacterium]|nr:hypothetical protein [Oscillospiraceae bacterium]
MQETYTDTRSCLDEEGLLHTFRYYLLTHHSPIGPFFLEEYGVMVEESGVEHSVVFPITHSFPKIQELMVLLVGHAVTPTNLADVVEDWIKENHLPQLSPQQVVNMG